MGGKVRLAVTDALNGDIEQVDPAVRRALVALSTEADEHAAKMASQHVEIIEAFDAKCSALEAGITKLRTLLISTAMTFMATLVATVVNIMVG